LSQYIHQVPGRIRVRSSAFRCPSERAGGARDRLEAMDGVREVRLNPRAGSITIHCDPSRLRHSRLLGVLGEVGCLAGTSRGVGAAERVGELFGKALVGAVMQKAVEQSARTLVGAFI